MFGSVMSIAANVLHTWIPKKPDGAPSGWTPPVDWEPSVAAQIGSAVWPVALLISVEVLSRVQWPDAWQWKAARYGGVGTVGLGSAIISYGHLHEVLLAWGYGNVGSAVGPLVLDGLMVVSGFALLAHGDQPAGSNVGSKAESKPARKQPGPAAVEPVAAPVQLHKRPTAAIDKPRPVQVVAAVDDPDDEPEPENETVDERGKRLARNRSRRARRKRADTQDSG